MTAATRVEVEISIYFFINCISCGGFCGVICGSGVSDIGWVVMVVVMMVMY